MAGSTKPSMSAALAVWLAISTKSSTSPPMAIGAGPTTALLNAYPGPSLPPNTVSPLCPDPTIVLNAKRYFACRSSPWSLA